MSNEDKIALEQNTAAIRTKIIVKATDELPEMILTDDDAIKSLDYSDERLVPEKGFIGHFVAKTLSGELQNISDDFNIEGRELEFQLGVLRMSDETTTWYSYGNFVVVDPKEDDVKDNTKFEAMDYAKLFNADFDGNYIDEEFTTSYNDLIGFNTPQGETPIITPVTALWLAKYTCKQVGVELATETFRNYDFSISQNPFQAGESCRDVMKAIGQLAFSWVRIGTDNECYIDFEVKDTSSVDELDVIDNNQYYSLEKQSVFGPINRVVVGMENIDGESYISTDQASIEENGEHSIYVYDNPLTNTFELRQQASLVANQLFGLTYVQLNCETVGHPWWTGTELIDIKDMQNQDLYTYPFNKTMRYGGHIRTTVDTTGTTEVDDTYGYDSEVLKNIGRAYIVVDKQNQTINALTEKQEIMQNDLHNNYYTKTSTDEILLDTINGFVNKYTVGGGNNIFRNTGLYFESNEWTSGYEYWEGSVERTNNISSQSKTSMYLQNDSLSQIQEIPNDIYTVSFKYNQLNPLATATVTLNDVEYELGETGIFTQTISVRTNQIEIIFNCDIDNGYEIYELMGNYGETALIYSQNQNETKTDTVEISEGIKITSTATDSVLKANADGIRVEDASGNTTTEFLDTGTKTQVIEANKGLIANLLIESVDGQTWITRVGD